MEKINERNEPANNFELHCQQSSEKNACWNLFCTTCACHDFRSGIYAIMKDGTFQDNEQWHSLCRSFDGAWFKWKVSKDDYLALSRVIEQASLRRISQSCKFPDWLGYLGICLSWFETWEREERLLSQTWGAQLLELCEEKDTLPESTLLSKIKNRTGPLYYYDLEYFEIALSPSRF